MGMELTFRELIHSLSDYKIYSEMYEDYEEDDKAFWNEYYKYMSKDADGEYFLDDSKEDKLVNFLIATRDKWFRDKLEDLISRYEASTSLDIEESVKLTLRYLGLSYKKLINQRDIQVKALQKNDDISDCIIESTFELFTSYITNIYYKIFEAFIVDYDLDDYESSGEDIKDFESIPDSVFDKWVSDNKLEDDLTEDWTAFYIYIYMANMILGRLHKKAETKWPLDKDTIGKLSQRVAVLYRYVWFTFIEFGTDINRLL